MDTDSSEPQPETTKVEVWAQEIKGISYYLDNNGKNAIELGLYGVPETYFVDKNGVIKYKHVGPITRKQFRSIISILGI